MVYAHPLQDRSKFFYRLIFTWSNSRSPHDSRSPPPLKKLGCRSLLYCVRSTHKIKVKKEVREGDLESPSKA